MGFASSCRKVPRIEAEDKRGDTQQQIEGIGGRGVRSFLGISGEQEILDLVVALGANDRQRKQYSFAISRLLRRGDEFLTSLLIQSDGVG
jgi:hypothetical protein